MEKKYKHMGVADAYGLESIIYFDRNKSFALYIRALANRHRHAVYYETWLTEEDVQKIRNMMDKRKWQEALKELKKHEIAFPEKDKEEFESSWRIIPNPKLDKAFQQNIVGGV
jgi:hypothetical protein